MLPTVNYTTTRENWELRPPPEVTTCKSGMVRLPKGATPLPMQGRDRPQLGGWGLYGYSRYLLPEK